MAEYILVERTSQRSVQNGVTMWRLTFYCIQDGAVLEMTVDPTYRNFRGQGWDHVVESDQPWGVYTGLRRTQRHTRAGSAVLTADRAAELIYRCRDQLEAVELMQANEADTGSRASAHLEWS